MITVCIQEDGLAVFHFFFFFNLYEGKTLHLLKLSKSSKNLGSIPQLHVNRKGNVNCNNIDSPSFLHMNQLIRFNLHKMMKILLCQPSSPFAVQSLRSVFYLKS